MANEETTQSPTETTITVGYGFDDLQITIHEDGSVTEEIIQNQDA